MKTEITRLGIENEMDIVLAHRRAMQIARFGGINISDQTRFATAVSEICRNSIEYCKTGEIIYSINMIREGTYTIEANVTDCGPGIENLEIILKRDPQTHLGKGRGIVFSKKLVDTFKISSSTRGTHVILGVYLPPNGSPVNNLIVQGWITYIKKEQPLTAYEELKIRNTNLLQLTDELKEERAKNEKQIAEIKTLNERLQKTNNNMEEFTYTVSHDLKTPLTSLKLSLGLLEETDDPTAKIAYIEIISRAAKRLDKTIQGLVEILDLQTKEQNFAKKINLDDFIKDIREEFSSYLLAKPIAITHKFMVNEICYIEPYLNSIFLNLISNSIKYRRVGQPLNISISSVRKNGMVLFTFTDNAEGIDLQKNGSRLFTPFSRFNNQQEGKGIGLYIIKKMVEKNDGYIEVESTPGKGTSFRIYLKEYSYS